jgi:hypothetical protein
VMHPVERSLCLGGPDHFRRRCHFALRRRSTSAWV